MNRLDAVFLQRYLCDQRWQRRQRETHILKQGNTNMATKSATKTIRNAKAAAMDMTTKAAKQNATVAKPAPKESKPTCNKMSQIEEAVAVLANQKNRRKSDRWLKRCKSKACGVRLVELRLKQRFTHPYLERSMARGRKLGLRKSIGVVCDGDA